MKEPLPIDTEIQLDDGRWVLAATYPQYDATKNYPMRRQSERMTTTPTEMVEAAAAGQTPIASMQTTRAVAFKLARELELAQEELTKWRFTIHKKCDEVLAIQSERDKLKLEVDESSKLWSQMRQGKHPQYVILPKEIYDQIHAENSALKIEVETAKADRNRIGAQVRSELLTEDSRTREAAIRFMLKSLGEHHGCLTGDCPHTTNEQCVKHLAEESKQ